MPDKYSGLEIRDIWVSPKALIINWSCPSLGFGQFVMNVNDDGSLQIDTEAMSGHFVMRLMQLVLNELKGLDTFPVVVKGLKR